MTEFKIDWHKAIEDAAIDYADEHCEMQCDSENDHQRAHREALFYLRETIKAALSKAPAWHDAPTEPGVWMSSTSNSVRQLDEYDIHNLGKYNSSRRWFGPISQDTEDTK